MSTFLTLYDDLLDIELASADLTQLFTTARRKQAVNDGMQTFVRQTGCTKTYGEISIVDGVGEYNVYAFLTDWIRRMGPPSIRIQHGATARYLQGPFDFPRHDPEELDRISPGWRSVSAATPASWYLREETGQLLLGATPAPSITVGDVWDWIVPYLAKPSVLSAASSEPFTVGGAVLLRLEPYHQALVHYAAGLLEPLRKNYAAAQRQMSLYNGFVEEYRVQEQKDGPDQITLLRDYYGEQQRGTRAQDPRSWP
jgi:hypothetical protein